MRKGKFKASRGIRQIALSTGIIFVLTLTAFLAPLVASHDPYQIDLSYEGRLRAPSVEHLFGTDHLGRDVFSRTLYGARISLSVGLVAVFIMLLVGVSLGAVSGYYGGWIDAVIMRLTEVALSFPTIFLIMMILAFVGPNIVNVMVIIGLTSWPQTARLTRAEALTLKERDFMTASMVLGASDARLIVRHLLPNAMAPIMVNAVFSVAGAILTESALSFLGLGVQIPMPSWGNILMDGKNYMDTAWWIMLFPGLFIFISVLSYNMLADGLRNIFDPRMKAGA